MGLLGVISTIAFFIFIGLPLIAVIILTIVSNQNRLVSVVIIAGMLSTIVIFNNNIPVIENHNTIRVESKFDKSESVGDK